MRVHTAFIILSPLFPSFVTPQNLQQSIEKIEHQVEELSADTSKFAVEHVTPFNNQAGRGTCWDFATIGMVEYAYRQNGIEKGFLEPDQYVKFSEQAYGDVVLEKCKESPEKCLIPGDDVWMNSTEGGEIPLIYSLNDMNNALLPTAVCPYDMKHEINETSCPGLKQALKTNPVDFEIKDMKTYFGVEEIKRKLREANRAMGFSTVMTNVRYFAPCTGRWAHHPECQKNDDECQTLCPFDGKFIPGSCCITISRSNYNLDAEFYSHGQTDYLNGGHAMLLVGYNDNFVTQNGNVGGFILKNNWLTASHSIDYFMQKISRWDESVVCPNSMNPRNWYACTSIEDCLSEKTRMYAEISYQPHELKCVADPKSGVCKTDPAYTYFIKNFTHTGDDMFSFCMFEYKAEGQDPQHPVAEEFCLDPFVLEGMVDFFAPVKVLPNDQDNCGFFFFPYDLVKEWWQIDFASFVTDFEFDFKDQSYAANKEQALKEHQHLDYSLLDQSLREQKSFEFEGPFPYDYLPNLKEQIRKTAASEYHKKEVKAARAARAARMAAMRGQQ